MDSGLAATRQSGMTRKGGTNHAGSTRNDGTRDARRSTRRTQQKDRAADRRPGAVSVLLRDTGQERADRGDQRQRQIVGHLGFLPGQGHSQDHSAERPPTRRRLLGGGHQPIQRPRPRSTSRSKPGAKTAERYESDPKTGNGRKELAERAKEEEGGTRSSLAKYHHYEISSAAFQIGIVLASAAVITEMVGLAWFAGLLGAGGLVLLGLGLFAPHFLPLP